MVKKHFGFALLLSAFLSCEGPKRNAPPESPAPEVVQAPEVPAAPEKPAEPPPPPPKPVSPPTPQLPDGKHQHVDGRVPLPAVADKPKPAASVLQYTYGQIPPPAEPKNGSVKVVPVAEVAQTPVRNKLGSPGRILLEPYRSGWESYLLAKGLDLLDRREIPAMEREFFLQDARFEVASLPQTVEETVSKSDNSQSKSRKEVMIGERLLGRDVFRLKDGLTLHWVSVAGVYFPMVGGRNLPPTERIESGRMLPANSLLDLGEIASNNADLQFDVEQPVAEKVAFVPKVAEEVIPPSFTKGEWKLDEQDPFRWNYRNGVTYFDPKSKSLWCIKQALVGRVVSRADYIKRRSKTIDFHCPECDKVIAERATRQKPSDADVPVRWQCTNCKATGDVVYLDGYSASPLVAAGVEVHIQWQWLDPKPGIFPVLEPDAADPVTGMKPFQRKADQWKPEILTQAYEADALLGSSPFAWCKIDAAGVALLLPPAEIATLRRALPPKPDAAAGQFPLPVVDSQGAQVFELSGPTHKTTRVTVPLRASTMDLRLVSVLDSRVLCSGTMALSYQNLMTGEVTLPVTVQGLDLTGWPSVEQQAKMLEIATKVRVANVIAQ